MSRERGGASKKTSGQYLTAEFAEALDESLWPRSAESLARWLATDASCLQLLALMRWTHAPRCPSCHATDVACRSGGQLACFECGGRCDAAWGTALERLPGNMASSLMALWQLLETRVTSARLASTLGVSDERFLWPWLDEVGAVMEQAESGPLRGVVEVAKIPIEVVRMDERRRPRSSHVMVAIAAELRQHDLGHVRVRRLARVDSVEMTRFVRSAVATGSVVRTSNWRGYQRLRSHGYRHLPCYGSDENGEGNLQLVQRLASLLRLWMWSRSGMRLERLDHHLRDFSYRWGSQVRISRQPSGQRMARGAVFRDFMQVALAHNPERLAARSA